MNSPEFPMMQLVWQQEVFCFSMKIYLQEGIDKQWCKNKICNKQEFPNQIFQCTIPIQFKALKYDKPCNVIYAQFP